MPIKETAQWIIMITNKQIDLHVLHEKIILGDYTAGYSHCGTS
jgi:hypothetical protein